MPERSATGHRQYSDGDVAQLKRISWFRAERGLNPAAIREALEAKRANSTADRPLMASNAAIAGRAQAAGACATQPARRWSRWPAISASPLRFSRRWSARRRAFRSPSLHNLAEYFGTTVSSLSGEDEPDVRGAGALRRMADLAAHDAGRDGAAAGRRPQPDGLPSLRARSRAPPARAPTSMRARNSSMCCRAGWNSCSIPINSTI